MTPLQQKAKELIERTIANANYAASDGCDVMRLFDRLRDWQVDAIGIIEQIAGAESVAMWKHPGYLEGQDYWEQCGSMDEPEATALILPEGK